MAGESLEVGIGPQPIPQPMQLPPAAPTRTLRDYLHPARITTPSCIAPLVEGHFFHFRPAILQHLPTFHGVESKNTYIFLREFEKICSTFYEQQCPFEIIHLKLFPFALKDKAKMWLNSLRVGSVQSWQGLKMEFLKKFFPMHRTNSYKKNSS